MNRLRLPLRLARREVAHRPGRTALVALLVALPVAGMALAITLVRTGTVTPQEEWSRRFGQADAVAFGTQPAHASSAPAGSRSVTVSSTEFRALTTDGHRGSVQLSDLPLLDPLAAGVHDLVDGRAATHAGEVVLSTSLAHDLGVGVGSDLELQRPAGLAWTVVGLVEPVGCLSCGHAIVAPGTIPPSPSYGVGAATLIDLPPMTIEAEQALLDANGDTIQIRDLVLADLQQYRDRANEAQGVRWSLVVGALVLTVAGIVISAAFAVGARRQLVTLGQLSASGASPATVRAALVLQGTVTGALGVVAGLVLWAGALVVFRPVIERFLDFRVERYVIQPLEIVAAGVVGLIAATLAALVPARTAAQLPTLAALAGRRPVTPVSGRQVRGGLFAFIGGLGLLGLAVLGGTNATGTDGVGGSVQVWLLVAILGGVAELLGACALAPLLVARLEPLGGRLRGSWRLGARSLARHRSRTGAVVSAVSAAGALAVAAGGLVLGAQARQLEGITLPDDVVVVSRTEFDATTGLQRRSLPDDALVGELETLLPGSEEVVLRASQPDEVSPGAFATWTARAASGGGFAGYGYDQAVVADTGVLELMAADGDVRSALADAGIVVITSARQGDLPAGLVVVDLPDGGSAEAIAVRHRYAPGYYSQLLISEAKATELGLALEPIATALVSRVPLTEGQRDALEDIRTDAFSPQGPQLDVQWTSPRSGPTPFQVELILSGVALVFSLFVVGVSLALAAAESKDERDVLTIAGAPPAALARSAGVRGGLLAAISPPMAIPVGFLPVVVFAKASSSNLSYDEYPIVFPVRTALLLVLAVPAVVALASLAASATAQRLRPVRVSTATFE